MCGAGYDLLTNPPASIIKRNNDHACYISDFSSAVHVFLTLATVQSNNVGINVFHVFLCVHLVLLLHVY